MKILFCLLMLSLTVAARAQSLPDTLGKKWWRPDSLALQNHRYMTIKAQFTIDMVVNPTEQQVNEWLGWQFGLRGPLPSGHPLKDLEIRNALRHGPVTVDIQVQ